MMKDLTQAGSVRTLTVRNMIYSFRWCPPGEFIMGCPQEEVKKYEAEAIQESGSDPDDEDEFGPFFEYGLHKEQIPNGFWILETPVTQKMWDSIMPKNWGYNQGDDLPIDSVSYMDARSFCEKLIFLRNLPPNSITLPTEVQWEYACRAGTSTPFSFGSKATGSKANFDCRYPFRSSKKESFSNCRSPVRSFAPNAWGIYDMHGNVNEWCESESCNKDWMGQDVQPLRGGSYADKGVDIRAASRILKPIRLRDFGFGFRILWQISE